MSNVIANESVGPPSSKRAKLSDSTINDDQVQLITNEEQFNNETDGKKKYPPEYPPYYHENFKIVLHDVLSSVDSRGILVQEEKDFVAKFSTLSDSAQLLFVRLYLRKRRWLRADKISYLDISNDCTPLLEELCCNDFLHNESILTDASDCLELLQVPELKSLCKSSNLPLSLLNKNRQEITDGLMKHCRQYKPLFTALTPAQLLVKKCKSILGCCVKVSITSDNVFSRIFLLFSVSFDEVGGAIGTDEGNQLQSIIYRILEVKTGKRVYPHYEICADKPIFHDRSTFERYFTAHQLLQHVTHLIDTKTMNEVALDSITSTAIQNLTHDLEQSQMIDLTGDENAYRELFGIQFTSGQVYSSVLTLCSESYEKLKKYEKANEILQLLLQQRVFARHSRGRWLERYTLNLDHHLGEKLKCLQVIKESLLDLTLHVSKHLSLYQRAGKILQSKQQKQQQSKPSNKTKTRHHLSDDVVTVTIEDLAGVHLTPFKEVIIHGEQHPTSCLFMASINGCVNLLPVEGYAVHHYTTIEGWPKATHCEGSLFSTLFGLLMWNEIYSSSVADVFRGHYQTLPLDFGREYFYNSRKEIIHRRLEEIKSHSIEDLVSEVASTYASHHGQLCPLIDWERFPSTDIKELVQCINQSVLVDICDLFSHNYYQNRGGLPDLVFWNIEQKKIKFVEVKGPGDRLSFKQMIWLSRLMDWHCEAEVCRVEGSR